MRILFLSNLYPPHVVGGYERLCFEVASAMAARGHAVSVLTSDFGARPGEAEADIPGQAVHRDLRLLVGDGIYAPFAGDEAGRAAINAANLGALRRRMAEARPDVVFAWNLFFLDRSVFDALGDSGAHAVLMLTDNWLVAMLEPAFMSGFFREHVFGDAPFPPSAPPPPGPLTLGWTWLRRRLGTAHATPGEIAQPSGRLPHTAIYGATFVRDLYAAAGIRFARDDVVHNGVPQEARPASAFRDRREPVEPGVLRLLFAGRLVDLKGAHTAVEAMPILDRMDLGGRQVRLTIVGDARDAAYADRLRGEIARSSCAARIALRDPVPPDALFALFQSHDVYLFPSLYEPFSLTLIHAMAGGIPVAASRAGGNVEIVRDGETGSLFRKGDAQDLARAVAALAGDGEARQRIAVAARAVAGAFTFDVMIGEIEHVLRTAAR